MTEQRKCRFCGKEPCPDDCEELQIIYRERQREILADIEIEDEDE